MNDIKQAQARIALAEFEARRLREISEARARRWRLATNFLRVLLALAAGVYLQVSHWQISGAQACGLFLMYLATSFLEEHRMRETIHKLQAEVQRLTDEFEKKSA